MIAEEYLNRSRLFRRLRNGPHGLYVELCASQLVKIGLSRRGTWRSLNLIGDLLNWLARIGSTPTDLNERMVELYLRRRSRKQSIQPGDRAALKRFLLMLREVGAIALAAPRAPCPRSERGVRQVDVLGAAIISPISPL